MKTTTSVVLASLLATSSLVAEESGFFGGVNLGYGVARPSGAGIPGGSYGGFRYGLIGVFIENKEAFKINMWVSLDENVLINVSENNADKLIRYLYERFPY